MSMIRPPAVAGAFYPAEPEILQREVRTLLRHAVGDGPAPKALIAPHAGYLYSGAIAASAYAHLRSCREMIRRVVLLGPAHRVAFHGCAVSSAEAFATPLGRVTIDQEAVGELLGLPSVHLLDRAHALEHSLEVQLPFLQEALDDFSLVPIVVGEATPVEVAEVLETVWGGEETLIVISSDLSHYQPYAAAQQQDRATSAAIVALRPEEIDYHDACGRLPICGLLLAARRRNLTVTLYDLRNSGDTAGDHARVVGYGAYGLG